MSCSVGHRCGSDPALLWLRCRPAAAAPTGPLAWEPPYAAGAAQEVAKRQKNKTKQNKRTNLTRRYNILKKQRFKINEANNDRTERANGQIGNYAIDVNTLPCQ